MPDEILWIPCNPYAACLLILFRTNLGKAYLEEALDSNKDIKHLNLLNYALQTPQVKSLNYELLNYNNIIKLSLTTHC